MIAVKTDESTWKNVGQLSLARSTIWGALFEPSGSEARRAAVGRAIGLQPAVSLVPGYALGRTGLRPLELYAQPGAAARARRGGGVFSQGGGAGARAQAALRRALHGGRHPDRGLGLA